MSASSVSAFVPRCRRESDERWHHSATGRRLIFLHIPKTAGTAITSYLRQQFVDSEVMPQLETPFHRSHPIWPLIARRYQLLGVGMHLEHEHVAAFQRGLANERPPFLLTVLREPRARLLSQYKEWRCTSDEAMQIATDELKDAILTARTQPFSVFLRSENPTIRLTLDNLQTRLLVGRNLSRTFTDTELLNRARYNLAQYDLVGTTASCDTTVAMLADAYGWPLPEGGAPRRHVSQLPDANVLAISPADEEQIAAFTSLDQALWDDLINDQLPSGSAPDTPRSSNLPASFCTRLVLCSTPSATTPAIPPDRAAAPSPQEHVREPLAHAALLACIYETVAAVVQEHAATRVFDLDRRTAYPMPADIPEPLSHDERVVFVVRLASLGYHASYLVLQAALPPASLLVITELENDPRLPAWLRQADVADYTSLRGTAAGRVVTVCIGTLFATHGSGGVTALLESLMRCKHTHPSTLKTLQDTPATRELAHRQLQHALAAVVHLAQSPNDGESSHVQAWLTPLLATLRPDDLDPLAGGSSEVSEPVASLTARLHDSRAILLTQLPPSSLPHLRFTLAVLQGVCEHLHTTPVAQRIDAYETVFTLLCHLLTHPTDTPSLVSGGRSGHFDFSGSLQVSNAHRLEGTGAESYRWLGPQRTSLMLIPVQPGVPQQLSVFIAGFMDAKVFTGATYRINGIASPPVCSVEEQCTVATFALSPEATTDGTVELTITAPFTASDLDKGLGPDTRQKSMALRKIRVTPEVAD